MHQRYFSTSFHRITSRMLTISPHSCLYFVILLLQRRHLLCISPCSQAFFITLLPQLPFARKPSGGRSPIVTKWHPHKISLSGRAPVWGPALLTGRCLDFLPSGDALSNILQRIQFKLQRWNPWCKTEKSVFPSSAYGKRLTVLKELENSSHKSLLIINNLKYLNN